MKKSVKLILSTFLIVGGLAITGCSSDKATESSPSVDNSAKIIKAIDTKCGTESCI
jgi:uncharacterized protein YcfL